MDKKQWKRKVRQACRNAGTYESWAESIIDTLAEILERRDNLAVEIDEMFKGRGVIPRKGNSNTATFMKNPALVMWTELNKVALPYWRELGLTPSAFRKATGEEMKKDGRSELAEALKSLSN